MNDFPVQALTVRPPYADLIAYGAKTVENRSWSCPQTRRWRLLHSGLSIDGAGTAELPDWFAPTLGRIIAAFRVSGSHLCDGSCSPWARPADWHWTIDAVLPLPEPVPCRGQQGLWTPPQHVLAACWKQLGDRL